jgi:prepilin-type N-terminal cleavage/methylation domain-containing protein
MLAIKHKQKQNSKSAFSLVELSIVLIIIGLLVAGVTAGQSLIVSARVTTAKALTESSPVTSIKGLTLWLDAISDTSFEDPDDIEQGDDVSIWKYINPQSSKNHFETPTGFNSPSYSEETINSLPAISFNVDGGNEDEILVSNDYFTDLSSTSFTFFMVADFRSGSNIAGSTILHQGDETDYSQNSRILLKVKKTNDLKSAFGDGALQGPAVSFSPEIYVMRYKSSGTLEMYINGDTGGGVSKDPDFDDYDLGSQKWTIGGSGGQVFRGTVGEIIFYDRRLRKSEIKDVISYLSQKWKIDTVEPY